ILAASSLLLAGSLSAIHWARSLSSSSSHGQPGKPLPQGADSQGLVTGVLASKKPPCVRKICQPPSSGAALLRRRLATDAQSIACISTLRPALSIARATTRFAGEFTLS